MTGRHRRCWEQDGTIVCHASIPVAFDLPLDQTIYCERSQDGDIPAEALLPGGEHYDCRCRSAAQASEDDEVLTIASEAILASRSRA